MDATALLTADHNRVRGLFARYQEASEAEDTPLAAELVAHIFTELEVHTAIEEEIFYPAVKGLDDEVAETVDEGIEEHHVVDVLMAEIRALAPGDDAWKAKMTVLIENVEHHAGEEEEDMFPQVRGALDAGALEDLGARLEAGKRERGAPTAEANADRSLEDLRRSASDQQIPGRSSMDREELEATVEPT